MQRVMNDPCEHRLWGYVTTWTARKRCHVTFFAPHQISATPGRTKIDETPYLKGMGKTRTLLLQMSVPMARFLH